ncbi:hypothetical protein IKR55_03775 [bacterium]|nr:hypothetical protein [bacterium]
MKKRYIAGAVGTVAVIIFLATILFGTDTNEDKLNNLNSPRLGQKLWTYNMNKYEWHSYNERDNDESKEEIILQYQGTELDSGYTSYKLLTGNYQVPKEDVRMGEGSQEFLIGKDLYSYLPRTFEYNQIIFNGVIFVSKKLSVKEVSKLFKDYQIIKLSEVEKGEYTIIRSKHHNKFILINDGDKDFYKYYIVPNDSKKMEIEKFSNQFTVSDDVDIKIQRLEGCTKAYPCYEIKVR